MTLTRTMMIVKQDWRHGNSDDDEGDDGETRLTAWQLCEMRKRLDNDNDNDNNEVNKIDNTTMTWNEEASNWITTMTTTMMLMKVILVGNYMKKWKQKLYAKTRSYNWQVTWCFHCNVKKKLWVWRVWSQEAMKNCNLVKEHRSNCVAHNMAGTGFPDTLSTDSQGH